MVEVASARKQGFPQDEYIVIASRFLPTYFGGLSQYQRMLGDHLSQISGASGVFLAENMRDGEQMTPDPNGSWKFVALDREELWRRGRAACWKLASRPIFHQLLERLICARWSRRIEEALPESVRAIHYVGTGWDLFGFALLQVARRRGLHFTVCPAVHPLQWGDDALDLRLYQRADRVFVLSDHEKHWLMEKGLPEEKMVLTGLPPMCLATGDGDRFRARYNLRGVPLTLFLGRKDEGKGYPALRKAWPQVRERIPNAVLVALGPLELKDDADKGEQLSILDLGVVSEAEKADALAACDVFCLPSAHESFGIVYIEAWSYGKPVICGTAPACRELIDDGQNGLWSSQEAKALTESLCRLLSDPFYAAEMGKRGQQEQRSLYTWERIGQLHLDEFCCPTGGSAATRAPAIDL